jgi:hypothetical protein
MSYPFVNFAEYKAEITFEELLLLFQQSTQDIPDIRVGSNVYYSMADAALSAFSIFFTQSPSFLDHQRALEKVKGYSNANSIFGIINTPTDNHIRTLLDNVPYDQFSSIYSNLIERLYYFGVLDRFRAINDDLLVAMDGTQYFSSSKIHCPNCNIKHHKNGTITYSHQVVTPVIVAPGCSTVLPMEPEFVTPQDGHTKQDCENAAAKRWLVQYGDRLNKMGTTILGDDLYCKQPICQSILDKGLNFILVCKPDSHKTLIEWIEGLQKNNAVTTIKETWRKGKKTYTNTYRFVSNVPLRDGDDALFVHWCELTTTDKNGKIMYQNSFATNHLITKDNVATIIESGRARWKVENENNNELKTKGYNLTHNFGHGKKNLSALLASLNILAFLFHSILDIMDEKFQVLRDYLPRKTFFSDLRALMRYVFFDSWDNLLSFMMDSLSLKVPDTG